jgi:hypothetical protein
VVSNIFLAVHHQIGQDNPHMAVSIRDLESLCLRLNILREEHPEASIEALAVAACDHEYGGIFSEREKAERWLNKLSGLAGVSVEAVDRLHYARPDLKGFKVTASRERIFNIFEEALRIREAQMRGGKNLPSGRGGILLEGETGIGKSEMVKKYLQAKGFEDREGAEKRYYQITAFSKNVEQRIKEAFQEGAILLLDEVNLEPTLERLLNQYLTGTDGQGKSARKPGFFIFATQNPLTYEGREALSGALKNRLHGINVPSYSGDELAEIETCYPMRTGLSAKEAQTLAKEEGESSAPHTEATPFEPS